MSPDDPRHGSDRGHAAHMRSGTPPCAPCVSAHTRMNKLRLLYPERFRKASAVGARRRIQALQALGYGRGVIAAHLGYSDPGAIAYLMSPKAATVTQDLDNRIREVYDRLSMRTPPTGAGPSRARTWAKRFGYAPPLAWLNIDDPTEKPAGRYDPHRRNSDIDEAVILRVLAGETLTTTRAEKAEITRRWRASGRPLAELERMTGWKAERYSKEAAA